MTCSHLLWHPPTPNTAELAACLANPELSKSPMTVLHIYLLMFFDSQRPPVLQIQAPVVLAPHTPVTKGQSRARHLPGQTACPVWPSLRTPFQTTWPWWRLCLLLHMYGALEAIWMIGLCSFTVYRDPCDRVVHKSSIQSLRSHFVVVYSN